MGISPNTNQPDTTFADNGEINPKTIEWVKNTPASTTHLPTPGSSWIESVSYDSSSLRLTINHKSGESSQYAMFYPAKFAEMQLAQSIGSFISKNVFGKHPVVKIRSVAKIGEYPERQNHVKKQNRYNYPGHRFQTKGRYS